MKDLGYYVWYHYEHEYKTLEIVPYQDKQEGLHMIFEMTTIHTIF